jgi:TolB-like protein/Flp pilus assembly protein TadD
LSLFRELKRRNVFRVAAAYLVTGWLLIEVSATLEDTLHLPDWADTLLAFFLILGFPVALFLSWAYEITPEGIKRDHEIAGDDRSRAITARRLDWTVIVVAVLAVGLLVADRLVPEAPPVAPAVTDGATTAPGPVEPTEAAADLSVAPLSIAVLPFVNMSSDPEQEYFSDGLTEELLNLLAGINELKVAARTSSFYYKDKMKEIPFKEIGRQLEVAHLLEGSVRKGGDQIRITAQLIKAEDGFHLWSGTWDRNLDDVFAIQDEIAAAVVDQLKVTLLGETPHASVIDTESWELTLQARYLFGRRAEGDLDQALELFQKATEIDPDNAAAWVGQAPLYWWQFDPPRFDMMLDAANKAVELDPDNPEAWSRKASALSGTGDQAASDEAWERAQELGQESPLIQSQLAGYHALRGEWDKAIGHQKRAVELDPLYMANVSNLANFLIAAGRWEEAEPYGDKLLNLAPTGTNGYQILIDVRLLQGRPDEALQLLDQMPPSGKAGYGMISEDPSYFLALIHHSLGNTERSDAALAEFVDHLGKGFPLQVAQTHAWRGEVDPAFEWLGRVMELDPRLLRQFEHHPFFAGLKDDPRWAELMARIPPVD